MSQEFFLRPFTCTVTGCIPSRPTAIDNVRVPKKPKTDAEKERELEGLYPLPEPKFTRKAEPSVPLPKADHSRVYDDDGMHRAVERTKHPGDKTGNVGYREAHLC